MKRALILVLIMPALLFNCKEEKPFYLESNNPAALNLNSLDQENGFKEFTLGASYESFKPYFTKFRPSPDENFKWCHLRPEALKTLFNDSIKVDTASCSFFQDKLLSFEMKFKNKEAAFAYFKLIESKYGQVMPKTDPNNLDNKEFYTWDGNEVKLTFAANPKGNSVAEFTSKPIFNEWLVFQEKEDSK